MGNKYACEVAADDISVRSTQTPNVIAKLSSKGDDKPSDNRERDAARKLRLAARVVPVLGVFRDPGDRPSLWVRRLSELQAHKLSKTQGADYPFWSPKNDHIAYFADGELKKISPTGGDPSMIALQFFGQGSASQAGPLLTLTVNGVSDSTFNYAVPAHGAIRFVTAGTNTTTQIGSMRMAPTIANPFSNPAIPAAFAVFSLRTNGITVSESSVSAEAEGIAGLQDRDEESTTLPCPTCLCKRNVGVRERDIGSKLAGRVDGQLGKDGTAAGQTGPILHASALARRQTDGPGSRVRCRERYICLRLAARSHDTPHVYHTR